MNANADLVVGLICWALVFFFFFWKIFNLKKDERSMSVIIGGGLSAYLGAGIFWYLMFPNHSNWDIKTLQAWAIFGGALVMIILLVIMYKLIMYDDSKRA